MPDARLDQQRVDRYALEQDLIAIAERRLVDPLEILLESSNPIHLARTQLHDIARGWAADLLGPNNQTATAVASRLLAALFGTDEFAPRPDWWQTPFGQLVARRVGYPGRPTVSGAEAAAMLGITRQGVHDLVRRGKIVRDSQGKLVTTSVQARIAMGR